ncbi:organic solvent tolerance protein OstA [Lysinibacillus odysseyi]|uniref:organic solvent tolerance protein OstA n=1 Tax=Lysinibacillus odysseyi TaxID=202611 RepID=UPI000AFA59A7|nr:organic solvent tolerance protein OstA [Lysinibacillus odysseyi]
MAKKLLHEKIRWYADTHKEAEEVVAEAKENELLTMQKIHEKHNSKGFYYLVDLEFTHSTAKEEMEKRPEKSDVPDGQMNMDEVEQQEEEFDPDSIQFEKEIEGETPQVEATESDLPF